MSQGRRGGGGNGGGWEEEEGGSEKRTGGASEWWSSCLLKIFSFLHSILSAVRTNRNKNKGKNITT